MKIECFILCILLFLSCSKIEQFNNIFDNKTIVCLGASNTERGHWVECLPNLLGGKYYNLGFGGSTIVPQKSNNQLVKSYSNFSLLNLAKYITSKNFDELEKSVNYILTNDGHDYRRQLGYLKSIDFSAVDIVLLSYGGNDFANSTKIGDIEDIDSFKGAMAHSINILTKKYPKLKFYVHTTCYRWLSEDGLHDTDNTKNDLDLLTIDYANAMIEISNNLNIPSINMMKESGFNKNNHNLYFIDGSHFNKEGGAKYAKRLSSWIQSRNYIK